MIGDAIQLDSLAHLVAQHAIREAVVKFADKVGITSFSEEL